MLNSCKHTGTLNSSLGRGIPMTMRAIEKMPGFDLGLKEIDEQFWAVLKLPEDIEI